MNGSNYNSWDSLRGIQDTFQNGFADSVDIEKELAFWSQASVQIESQNSPDPSFNQEVKISNPFVFNAKKSATQSAQAVANDKNPQDSSKLAEQNADYIVNKLLGISSQYQQNSYEKAFSNKDSYNYGGEPTPSIADSEHLHHVTKPESNNDRSLENLNHLLSAFLQAQAKPNDILLNNNLATDPSKMQAIKHLQTVLENQKRTSQATTPHNSVLNNTNTQALHFDPNNVGDLQVANYPNINHKMLNVLSGLSQTSPVASQNVSSAQALSRNTLPPTLSKTEPLPGVQSLKTPSTHKSQPILSNISNYAQLEAVDSSASKKKRSPSEEDKRKRNTAASARFRVKKKMKEKVLEQKNSEMEQEIQNIKKKLEELQLENKWLKNIITEKNSAELLNTGCPCHHPGGYLAHNATN